MGEVKSARGLAHSETLARQPGHPPLEGQGSWPSVAQASSPASYRASRPVFLEVLAAGRRQNSQARTPALPCHWPCSRALSAKKGLYLRKFI